MKWEVRTMRSGTSSFKALNGPVFKKTVLRYWPVWAAYSVIWLVVLPLQGLMMLQMDAAQRYAGDSGYLYNFARQTVAELARMAPALAAVFGLLAAMAVCSHLYNPRSANFFGALPVRREGLFATHYLAGLAFLTVPNVVIFLLTLLVEAAGGTVFLPGLGFWLAAVSGECLFFYSMAVFCGMFTGHILALPVFYGVFNVFAAGVRALAYAVLNAFYYGYSSMGYWADAVTRWLTPLWKLTGDVSAFWAWPSGAANGEPHWVVHGLDAVAVYAAAALALAAASFLLYRARRLESAGDVVSVRCMRPVFKYGVAICVGLAFGMGTAYVLNTREVGMMVSILIWGAVGYFAAQMLLDKSFRVFSKWKGAAAVSAVFLALFCVVGFDLTGYETRVPDPDQVASVSVSGLQAVNLGDGADFIHVWDYDDPETIARVTDLHRAAVDQREFYHGINGSVTTDLPVNFSVQLDYEMKDGSTLSRHYYNLWLDPEERDQEGTAAWAVERLYQDRGLYWTVYNFDGMEENLAQPGWRLSQVYCRRFTYHQEEGYQTGEDQGEEYFYGVDARALLDAVEEDFQAGRIGLRTLADIGWYPPEEGLELTFRAETGDGMLCLVEITVREESTSTLAALEWLEGEGARMRRTQPAQSRAEEHDVPPDGAEVEYPFVSDAPVPTAVPVS